MMMEYQVMVALSMISRNWQVMILVNLPSNQYLSISSSSSGKLSIGVNISSSKYLHFLVQYGLTASAGCMDVLTLVCAMSTLYAV